MKIYQEPIATAATPTAKTVSFGTSIHSPVPPRSGRKPLALTPNSNNNHYQNTIRPRGTPHNVKSKQASSSFAKTTLVPGGKENHSSTMLMQEASSSPSPFESLTSPVTTNTSASSFRRALQGKSPTQQQVSITTVGESAKTTSAPQNPISFPTQESSSSSSSAVTFKAVSFGAAANPMKGSLGAGGPAATKAGLGEGGRLAKRITNLGGAASRATAGGGGALGPPQRVAPKTPNSLLRTELNMHYDSDDDSWNEQEESLLVSPPGALWNVLGVAHNPSSASSTGVVLVPPHTAAAIHELTTSQKKKQQERRIDWASPPLQPRSLLQTTPESDEEEEVEEPVEVDVPASSSAAGPTAPTTTSTRPHKACVEEEQSVLVSPRNTSTLPELRKAVSLDLSTMFSVNKPTPETSTASSLLSSLQDKPTAIAPPADLLLRLQKPTARSKINADDASGPTQTLPLKKSSFEALGEATSSADLLRRLRTPKARSKDRVETVSPTEELVTMSTLCSQIVSSEITEPEIPLAVEPEKKGSGLTMDMSDMFAANGSHIARSSPPPHLLERLSTRTVILSTKKATKEEIGTHSAVQKTRLPIKPLNKPAKKGNNSSLQAPVESTSMVQGGLVMDMPTVFADDSITLATSSRPMPTPPPHLLKRLQQRTATTFKKSSSGTSKGKENKHDETGSNNADVVSIARMPLLKTRGTAATKPKVVAPNRASSPLIPSKEAKTRNPLKRNDNFFPKQASRATAAQDVTIDSMVSQAVAFDIAAPQEKAVVPAATLLKHLVPKVKSPIKIARDSDDWAGKQCDTFVSWLNYTFHPDEDEDGDPGTRRSGLRALVIHRRLAQVRFRAAELFQSEAMRRMRTIVQTEIAKGRLTIRTDRDLYADLSLRKQATQLLLSYTTPWLRLALEVMFGECILPEQYLQDQALEDDAMTPVARMRATLRAFVVDRVLADSNVLMKYTKGRTNVPSGKFEKLYREEMRTLVLYRLMVLILFLDHAKMANIIDKVPRLFIKSSEVKSSKAVLLSVCRNFLSAEGDFIKHLSRMGLHVAYVQDPIDELDFNVSNLAVDLRDGGRLTRLTELVTETPFKQIMRALRLPAISRLQKMHNVNVAISKLKEFGIFVPDDVNAHHIVDAHREMVLKLMWSIIAHTCMTKLLDGDQVEQEINNVLRSGKARRKLGEGLRARSPRSLTPDKSKFHYDYNTPPEEVVKSLLLRWCKAVCSNFGLQLTDFTSSFADGKALCYLVHYYHPAEIRLDEILPTSNDKEVDLTPEQALSNERANSAMVAKRVTELGGIPKMLPITDCLNPPDERSVLLCLTYLCSRLMESSEEIFATILIQACYRRYREKVLQEQKEAAAWTIFQIWCDHKDQYFAALQQRYAAAVVVLENFVLCHMHGLQRMKRQRLERERREVAAIDIQRRFRGFQGRTLYETVLERNYAVVVIQKYYRRFTAQLDLLEAQIERDAATSIQASWRCFVESRRCKMAIGAVLEIQRVARGSIARIIIRQQHLAAIKIQKVWWSWVAYADSQVGAILIQSRWRGVLARQFYSLLSSQHNAATLIQKVWRGYSHAIVFAIHREFAISIQKIVRGYLSRRTLSLKHMSHAATLIQKAWRGFMAQLQFNMDVMDIVSIQTLARKIVAANDLRRRRQAVTCLQGSVRCALSRRELLRRRLKHEHELQQSNDALVCQCAIRVWRAKKELLFRLTLNESARTIQSSWRKFVVQACFIEKKTAATRIQSAFRGLLEKRTWQRIVVAATVIQSHWRCFVFRKLQHSSATAIQSRFRARKASKCFRGIMESVVTIQASWRSNRAFKCYQKGRMAAIRIQAAWRRFFAIYNFDLDVLEIVIAQSIVRRMLAQRRARRSRNSIQTLQNFARHTLARRTLDYLRSQHEDYVKRHHCAVKIQCYARICLAKKSLSTNVKAATKIASFVRRVIAQRSYCSAISAAVFIQAFRRGQNSRRFLRRRNDHAIILQRVWRGFSQYIKYSLALCEIVSAQSVVRRYLARKLAALKVKSVLRLQSQCRRLAACRLFTRLRIEMAENRRCNHAAAKIQAVFRGTIVRRDLWWKASQATLIQSFYRGRVARILFELHLFDVTAAQSLARVWLAKRLLHRRYQAVITLQVTARSWFARRIRNHMWAQKQRIIQERNAAIGLQKVYRGYLVRRDMEFYHLRATLIQTAFRRHYHCIFFEMFVVDVTIVQSIVRRWVVQRELAHAQACALTLQCFARRVSAARSVSAKRAKKALWDNQNFAAMFIQRLFRGYSSRKLSTRHASARKIQKTWRCFTAHVEYLVQQISVVQLQAEIRRMQAQQRFRKHRQSIVKFQALSRGFLQRDYLRFVSMSALLIQAIIRQRLKRKQYLKMRNSATLIQGVARGYFVRDELELQHFAASEIQRVWRGFSQFCDFFVHIEAVVTIQASFRMCASIRVYRDLQVAAYVDHRFFTMKAKFVQRSVRTFLRRLRLIRAATKIQRLAKVFIHRTRATIVDRGVKRLQAVLRAKITRRCRSKKIVAVANRLEVATVKAKRNPSLQIGHKTRHALKILQTSKSLAEIMDAVKSLETSTRLSSLCCALFVEADAARILLDLIRSCNRSVPHVELVHCILLTLDNVSQFRKLVPSFADCNSAEIFLDKMQMFRDKEGIFCLSISLLQCIAECNPLVEEFCAMHEHLKRIKALYQLSLRRSKTTTATTRRDGAKKNNRMKRREHFDRNVAVRALGTMASQFESHSILSPTNGRAKHFKF